MRYASNGDLTDELIVIHVCEHMKWDYDTYLRQPHWFVEGIIEMQRIDRTKPKNKLK